MIRITNPYKTRNRNVKQLSGPIYSVGRSTTAASLSGGKSRTMAITLHVGHPVEGLLDDDGKSTGKFITIRMSAESAAELVTRIGSMLAKNEVQYEELFGVAPTSD